MKVVISNVKIPVEKDQGKELINKVTSLGIKRDIVVNIETLRRSIDSRKIKNIVFIYKVEVTLSKRIDISKVKDAREISYKEVPKRIGVNKDQNIVIVGAGPCGLFAGLKLVKYGFKPIIMEQGEKVEDRDITTENFVKGMDLDPWSNIQFGEGGAGTYSDGKLNTRVKSGYIDEIFKELVTFGANEQILWDYKPHIGTDILKKVVVNIRKEIIRLGGTFHFNEKVVDIILKDKKIDKLITNTKDKKENIYEVDALLLGTGHSARDIYRLLHKIGVFLEEKPFAIGTRMEHKRVDIDTMQYGPLKDHPNLEAATYAFTYNNKKEDRGTFSFCMCPGGEIVNATSSKNTNLVNGMSYSTRDGEFSNSAIVVGVKGSDFGRGIFAGMKLQEELEKKAYDLIGGYGSFYQGALDFLNNKKTEKDIKSSYRMDLKSMELDDIFPEPITKNLRLAISNWSKNKYFVNKDTNLIGLESRTSAPIRITRGRDYQSISTKGLYPIGEGAGYAGGIISAAIDGSKIVDEVFTKIVE